MKWHRDVELYDYMDEYQRDFMENKMSGEARQSSPEWGKMVFHMLMSKTKVDIPIIEQALQYAYRRIGFEQQCICGTKIKYSSIITLNQNEYIIGNICFESLYLVLKYHKSILFDDK